MIDQIELWQGFSGIGRWLSISFEIDSEFLTIYHINKSIPFRQLFLSDIVITPDQNSPTIVKLSNGLNSTRIRFKSKSKKETFLNNMLNKKSISYS